jgi:hypothetical protein
MSKPIPTYNERLDFSWEFHDYAIKTIHEDWQDRKSKIREDCPIELVKYNDSTHKSCYTLAYFRLDDEGYELHSVGGRLFDNIQPDEIAEIWAQLQAGQKMLDAYFEACYANRK